jgi:cysteine-rich repeat protein
MRTCVRRRHPLRLLPPAVILLTAFAAQAAAPPILGLTTVTVSSTEPAFPIPDNSSVISLMTIENLPGVVADVDLTVDIAHSQSDQLDIFLVSPSGRTVTLTTDNGQGNDDVFGSATFDDQATGTPSAPNVRNITYADKVAVGPIQPEEAMGAFVGEPAEGPWALVLIDDTGGTTGTLRGWSLSVSAVPAAVTAAPIVLSGEGGTIPSNNPDGRVSQVTVTGAGAYVWDVDVTVDIAHPRADEIDLFLTSPSGRRIDLVTDVGGGNVDLYRGTTFDDQAGTPVSDATLPTSPAPFTVVVPEGALGAFVGEPPNGTWTLTVVDDQGGNTGTLNGWTLRLVTTTACGDGTPDPGEGCDDGNAVDGDGCDRNCTLTGCGNGVVSAGETCDDGNTVDGDSCPAGCRSYETACGDCTDDDGNGLVDAFDPACQAGVLELSAGSVRGAKLKLDAELPAAPAGGAVALQLAGSGGQVLCASLGDALPRRGRAVVRGRVAPGKVTVTLRGTRVLIRGNGMFLDALGEGPIAVGVRIGDQLLAGTATLRSAGKRRVFP